MPIATTLLAAVPLALAATAVAFAAPATFAMASAAL